MFIYWSEFVPLRGSQPPRVSATDASTLGTGLSHGLNSSINLHEWTERARTVSGATQTSLLETLKSVSEAPINGHTGRISTDVFKF